jgi:hypothetical protein
MSQRGRRFATGRRADRQRRREALGDVEKPRARRLGSIDPLFDALRLPCALGLIARCGDLGFGISNLAIQINQRLVKRREHARRRQDAVRRRRKTLRLISIDRGAALVLGGGETIRGSRTATGEIIAAAFELGQLGFKRCDSVATKERHCVGVSVLL